MPFCKEKASVKKSVLLLLICNWVLLGTSAVMAFYAYPRLPQKIPLWLNFFGQQTFMMEKSPLFFVYLLVQTLFFLFFLFVTKRISSRNIDPWKAPIFKEYVYLTLVFFNMIFIHVQRTLILVAYLIFKRKKYFRPRLTAFWRTSTSLLTHTAGTPGGG